MLSPKNTRYRKHQRGRVRSGTVGNVAQCSLGNGVLVAINPRRIRASALSAARLAAVRAIGRRGRVFNRLLPDTVVTAKPLETRMGKGKGPQKEWVGRARRGCGVLVHRGPELQLAQLQRACAAAGSKLPPRVKLTLRRLPRHPRKGAPRP